MGQLPVPSVDHQPCKKAKYDEALPPVVVKRPGVYDKPFVDLSGPLLGGTQRTIKRCLSKAAQVRISSKLFQDAGYSENQEVVRSAKVVYTLQNAFTEKKVLAAEAAATMLGWLGSGLCRQARRKLLRDMKAPELETELAELLGDFDKFNYNAKDSFLKVRPHCLRLVCALTPWL